MPSREYIFQEILEQERIAALHHTLSVPDWPAAPGKIIISGSGILIALPYLATGCWKSVARSQGCPLWKPAKPPKT